MTKLQALCFCAAATVASASCNSDPALPQMNMISRYALVTPDGFTSLYSGPNIATVIATGHIPGKDDPHPYFLLRVPTSVVEEVHAKPSKTISFSLETSTPVDVQIAVNLITDGGPKTVNFKPGAPWLSGFAQVHVEKDGTTAGLIEATKWTKHPTGNITIDQYTNGTVADDEAPKLKYNGPPNTWPELPPSWK